MNILPHIPVAHEYLLTSCECCAQMAPTCSSKWICTGFMHSCNTRSSKGFQLCNWQNYKSSSPAYVCTNVHDTMPIHTHSIDQHIWMWRQFCILESIAMVCSSSLQPQSIPYNSYALLQTVFFALQNCLHDWHVATSWVCVASPRPSFLFISCFRSTAGTFSFPLTLKSLFFGPRIHR